MKTNVAASQVYTTVRARAKTLRPDEHAERVSLALSRAMRAARVSQRTLALKLGVSAALIAGWCNPASDATPSLRRLSAFPPTLYDALIRELGEATRPGDSVNRAMLVLARQHGELGAVLLEVLADGNVTRAEAQRVASEASRVEASASAIRRWATEREAS